MSKKIYTLRMYAVYNDTFCHCKFPVLHSLACQPPMWMRWSTKKHIVFQRATKYVRSNV